MSYYHTCPLCGAHLDPGEACDCRKEKASARASNAGGGGAESVDNTSLPDWAGNIRHRQSNIAKIGGIKFLTA